MAKTCGVCEKRVQVDVTFSANETVSHFRCGITGKNHPSDHQCDVPEKPRLCEVLGVDVGERFYFDDQGDSLGPLVIMENGQVERADLKGIFPHIRFLADAINHPEKIVRIHRLTPEEIQRCKAFGAKWVGRDSLPVSVKPEDVWALLFSGRPRMGQGGPVPEKETYIGAVRPELFPSVGLGELIQVEDEPSEGAAGQ